MKPNFFPYHLCLGESFAPSDYSAENVAERDFLRTEGDPGAAGYTIKEAVALTRSVVSLNYILGFNQYDAVIIWIKSSCILLCKLVQ